MIKIFSAFTYDRLETKVNDWLVDHPEYKVMDIHFEIGKEDERDCHYAYVWYEKTMD